MLTCPCLVSFLGCRRHWKGHPPFLHLSFVLTTLKPCYGHDHKMRASKRFEESEYQTLIENIYKKKDGQCQQIDPYLWLSDLGRFRSFQTYVQSPITGTFPWTINGTANPFARVRLFISNDISPLHGAAYDPWCIGLAKTRKRKAEEMENDDINTEQTAQSTKRSREASKGVSYLPFTLKCWGNNHWPS